jgi:hypothetical protein
MCCRLLVGRYFINNQPLQWEMWCWWCLLQSHDLHGSHFFYKNVWYTLKRCNFICEMVQGKKKLVHLNSFRNWYFEIHLGSLRSKLLRLYTSCQSVWPSSQHQEASCRTAASCRKYYECCLHLFLVYLMDRLNTHRLGLQEVEWHDEQWIMNSKGWRRKWQWYNLKFYPCIYLEGLS